MYRRSLHLEKEKFSGLQKDKILRGKEFTTKRGGYLPTKRSSLRQGK